MKARHVLFAALAAACIGPAARADDRGRIAQAPANPRYQAECAACHVAYPPGLLPGASWQRLMSNLQRHFGADASLDPATVRDLSAYLAAHAATDRRLQPPPPDDRITRTAWFARQHEDLPAAAWKRPAIKSASNCSACHTRADQGDFNERDVRVPR